MDSSEAVGSWREPQVPGPSRGRRACPAEAEARLASPQQSRERPGGEAEVGSQDPPLLQPQEQGGIFALDAAARVKLRRDGEQEGGGCALRIPLAEDGGPRSRGLRFGNDCQCQDRVVVMRQQEAKAQRGSIIFQGHRATTAGRGSGPRSP